VVAAAVFLMELVLLLVMVVVLVAAELMPLVFLVAMVVLALVLPAKAEQVGLAANRGMVAAAVAQARQPEETLVEVLAALVALAGFLPLLALRRIMVVAAVALVRETLMVMVGRVALVVVGAELELSILHKESLVQMA
jgi:hypothetical protein